MPAQPARYTPAAATDTVVHDLPPIRFDGQPIDIRLSLRRTEDGFWRGRILFGAEGTEAERSSAETFCAGTEPERGQAGRDLRERDSPDLHPSRLTELTSHP